MVSAGNYTVSRELLTDLTRLRAPDGQHDLIQEPAGFPLHNNWTLHYHSEPSVTGYDGALFSADIDGKPHYFIFHQGTNDANDFPSLAKLANGKTPIQHREACRFTDRALAFVAKHHPDQTIPVVQVGYSLGGALAIASCKDDQPVIAFESPGMRGVIENEGRDADAVGTHVLEILSPHANVVNAHGKHIGHILTAGEKNWETTRAGVADFIRLTSATHHIEGLGEAIESDQNLTTVPAAQAKRPDTVVAAFQEYMDDVSEMDSSVRKRLLEKLVDAMVATGVDQLLTRGVVLAGDEVATWLAREIYGAEAVEKQRERMKVVLDKAVAKQQETPQPPAPQPATDAPSAPPLSFTARLHEKREAGQEREASHAR